MAQPLSRPLVLSRSGPWPPAPPSPRGRDRSLSRSGSPRMPRSGSRASSSVLLLSSSSSWPCPVPPLPSCHFQSRIPAQPLGQLPPQGLVQPRDRLLPLSHSSAPPLSPQARPLYQSRCPGRSNPLAQALPSSLSLPLPPTVSHTLPLSQPRLRSGLQLPPALLLLLLFSLLGPGAGECRSRKD